jgi:chemotaxis protein histidine kinase CheA/CheY-like chemotaxis protein
MNTDKDIDALDENNEVDHEEQQGENLEWLLDLEETESEEAVFKVEGDDYQEQGLSDYEAQIASRPMSRGGEGGDDFSNFVGEEIVMSSDSGSSSIYGSAEDSGAQEEAQPSGDSSMAVDFTTQQNSASVDEVTFDEGTDILGLAADDDIGETALSIKRVKPAAESARAVAKADNQQVEVQTQQAEAEETVALAGDADAVTMEQSVPVAANATEVLDAVAGGDVSSSTSNLGDEPLTLEDLDDAPVPTQVASPDTQDVANEELETTSGETLDVEGSVEEGFEVNAEASAEESVEEDAGKGVIDYVASNPSSLDDESFDELLLQGEQDVSDSDLDDFSAELELEPMEGEISLDTSDDVAIDYPEELDLAGALNENVVTEIAALISALIQEVSEVAAKQVEALQLNVDALEVEAQIGVDEGVVEQCVAKGFQPLSEVLNWSPAALESVDEAVVEQMFIRLFDAGNTGQCYNDLFSREPVTTDSATTESATTADQPIEFEVADETVSEAADDPEAFAGFDAIDEDDDEIFSGVSGDLAETVETDDDFSGFDMAEFAADDLVFGGSGDDKSEISDDLDFSGFEAAGVELDEEPVEAELESDSELELKDEVEEPVEDVVEEVVEEVAEEIVEESEEEVVEGFSDDIFGDDFVAEFDEEVGDADSSDIDSAFSTLSAPVDDFDSGDFGLDMDELPAEAEIDSLEEAIDTDELEEAEEEVVEAAVEHKEVQVEETSQEPEEGHFALNADMGSDLSWCVPSHIQFSKTTQVGGDIFAEFLDAFIEEGSAEIEKLEDLVGEWEKNVASEAILADVNRTLHTVKGIAKGVGLQRFGTLIHNFETLLEAIPRPSADQEPTYFRMINVWLDAVVRGIEYVTEERGDVASELPAVAATQESAESSADVVAETQEQQAGQATAEEKVDPLTEAQEKKLDQQLADEGAKALAAQQSVRITSEKLDHLLNLASQSQQLCVRASQTTTRTKRSTAELQGRLSSVRTHIGKIADRALLSVNARGGSSSDLDALEMDQYSELQEAASILREGVEDLGDLIELVGRQSGQAEVLLKQQSSVISSISSSIQSARVVPVSRLMPGLRRIVRTVSTDLGKSVTFKVLNEIGALDRDHYARLQVVLEHMVRNALDHGIESSEDRLALGKPSAGLITVDVKKSGGDYIIQLADDGKGIDPDAIRESAYEKGIDVDVDALSDEEALRLIFHKGFSTAAKVSEISGRGVGMDIVLSELAQIGGEVHIRSALGQGTTFEVKIPSNVSVNGALMVASGDDSYAIPLNGLIAVEQVPAEEFFTAVKNGDHLSLFDMECEPSYLATLCQGVPLPERNFWEAFVPVIIAGTEDRRMAIAIDDVEEALELVVRSLGTQFSNVPGLAGAATTADGEAIVALDLNMLVQSLGVEGREQMSVEQEEHSSLLALVVDDSRTQRMVATSQLDTVGVETVTAENGLVAIDLLNAAHRLPDVVLLDVEMPVKDGIETLREIRKSQRYGHIPVIMVTSRTGAKHRALAKEAGCNAYMGKPFNFPAMVEQINVLTGHSLQLA